MSQLFGGNLCLTDLIEKAKAGHSAFQKSKKNGKIYVNVLTWVNDEPDKYGNTMSHQLGTSKEMREKEGKFYIGNSKVIETSTPVKSNDIDDSGLDNVAEREPKQTTTEPEGPDDLPF